MGILTNNSAVNNHTFTVKMKYNISILEVAIKARQVTFSSQMKDISNRRRGFIEVIDLLQN